MLLAAGTDPDAITPLGWTALQLAARNGSSEIVELLLAAGADPELSTHTATSPLIQAVKADQPGVAAKAPRRPSRPPIPALGATLYALLTPSASSWWC